jgi:hypothetical protein
LISGSLITELVIPHFYYSMSQSFTAPAFSIRVCLLLLAIIALAFQQTAKAVSPTATSILTETATNSSSNTFTLTLQNTSASFSLETFWFAWIPGQDYLATSPLTVQTPTGFTDTITGGGVGDGFAIRFSTSTAPLAAGASLSGFGFTSTDSLAQMQGDSSFFPTTKTTTSEVTTGPNDTGTASSPFVVAAVPEPAPIALVASALCLAFFARRRGGMA